MVHVFKMLVIMAWLPVLAASQNSQAVIFNQLMAGYDYTTRPSESTNCSGCCGDGTPDEVGTDIGVEILHSVNQKSLSYRLEGYIRMHWRDPRLAFSNSSCRESIVLPSPSLGGRKIWTPDLYIEDAVSQQMGGDNEGEMVVISRDGSIFWSRRLRVEMACRSFNFGQFPYDTQFCKIEIGVYRYAASEVQLSWTASSAINGAISEIQSARSGVWTVSLHEARMRDRIYPSGAYRYATGCLKFERSARSYKHTLIVSILLVAASYSGFFIAPSAAPARVSLSFLCFLMVINNLNSVYASLPPLAREEGGGTSIWFVDMLAGTTAFNFVALVEYGLVHHGITVHEKWGRRTLYGNESCKQGRPVHRVLDFLRFRVWMLLGYYLDAVMRWVFPIAYFGFFMVMFSLLPEYPCQNQCVYS